MSPANTLRMTSGTIVVLLAALAVATAFAFWRPDVSEAWFTALGAGAATYLTWGLWKVSQDQLSLLARQNEAQLMLTLMTEYDGLRDSIATLVSWHMQCAENDADPAKLLADEVSSAGMSPFGREVSDARFRVSRFFVRTRKLVQQDYLDEQVVRSALGGRAIEDIYLALVDPLDAAVGGQHYNTNDRDFYLGLLRKYPRPDGPRA